MARRPHICFTFIGDITRDSRCSRMMATCAKDWDVTLISLHDADTRFAHSGAEVLQSAYGLGRSLRRRLAGFWREGISMGDRLEADIYIASDLYSLPLAARLAARHGSMLMYDSRELYSDIAALQGRGLAQRFWNLVEGRYARRAEVILTVNASISEILRTRYPATPVHVLRNLPLRQAGERDSSVLRKALDLGADRRILLSQGGLQPGRGAWQYLRIVERLENAVLVFLGDGPLRPELEAAVQLRELSGKVRFAGAVPWDVLPDFTAGADVGLCMIENLGRSYHLSLPNKVFEYIAAQVPVLVSDFPELSRVVHDYAVGLTADPSSDDDVLAAVGTLLDDEALRSDLRDACGVAAGTLNWEKEETILHDIVAGLLESR